MRKISRTEGVPADSCRSCMHDIKLLARNTNIHEQIYLSMVGKGLKSNILKSNMFDNNSKLQNNQIQLLLKCIDKISHYQEILW